MLADPAAKIIGKPVILEEQSGGILCAGAGAWWVVCKPGGGEVVRVACVWYMRIVISVHHDSFGCPLRG